MSLIMGYLVFVLPVIALVSAVCCLVLYRMLKRLKRSPSKNKMSQLFAFIVVMLTIMYATLGSVLHSGIHFVDRTERQVNFIPYPLLFFSEPLSERTWNLEQLLLNIAMFIPFSYILLRLIPALGKFYCSILVVLLCGVIIEGFQFFIGRVADINDLFAYTIGGCIGFMINKAMHRYKK